MNARRRGQGKSHLEGELHDHLAVAIQGTRRLVQEQHPRVLDDGGRTPRRYQKKMGGKSNDSRGENIAGKHLIISTRYKVTIYWGDERVAF